MRDVISTVGVPNASELSPLGELIFLDRYALKALSNVTLEQGNIVLVGTDLRKGHRELGEVVTIAEGRARIRLHTGTEIETLTEHLDKPVECHPSQMQERVARSMAGVETADQRDRWLAQFRWLLDDWRFVPAGRILTAAGTALPYNSCYVLPSPHDSRAGIMTTLAQLTELMARGPGVGVNISSLRPRQAYVKGVNGRSSGAVSWGELYSFVTGLVEQGGMRRGGLMLVLDDWHPDLFEFINSKRKSGRIVNANLSVGISDRFMRAMQRDENWSLVFPDTSHPSFDRLWDGNLAKWIAGGRPVVTHQTVKAREIWSQLVESAWASGEPGVLFVDTYNKMSNSWYYSHICCTNPCAEQGLPPWGVCNLGSLNLPKFVDRGVVQWDQLRDAVRYAVRFLDNAIDASPYYFPENSSQQQAERRVGIGTMGLAEVLIRLRVRYGSPDSVKLVDKLFAFIAREAYLASIDYASEKGAFPAFDSTNFLQSGYMKAMPNEVREGVRRNGIRNVTLLSQAPTGSIGTMLGASTGIEPYYSWSVMRASRLGQFEEIVSVVAEWKAAHPGDPLPDYFVTAMDLSPEEHIRIQAAVQRWIDASVSKTCNVPSTYTLEQTKELFELMYSLGCKGGTVYRDGSRDEQILRACQSVDSCTSCS